MSKSESARQSGINAMKIKRRTQSECPNGASASSPRLPRKCSGLPWVCVKNGSNANGVVAEVMRARDGNELAATALRLECLLDVDPGLRGTSYPGLWDEIPLGRSEERNVG